MRTRKLNISKRNNFRYSDSYADFKRMRAFVFQTSTIDRCFVNRMADLFDEIREMPIGSEVYFGCSEFYVYHKPTLEGLEETMNHMESYRETDHVGLSPKWHDMMVIKRTPKGYTLKHIDYEFI